MIPVDTIDEFVKRVREAGGANVESIILFGSAVAGDFHDGLSNLNMFCVLRDSSFKSLQALTPAAQWWDRKKQPPPLCMTREELARSTDVFTIELLDMQQHHRVLFGFDAIQGLMIPPKLHAIQVEYELREKLVLLRQHFLLAAGDESRTWDVLLRSVSSFATLFRHGLIVLGHPAPASKREAVNGLAQQLRFDASGFLDVLNVREKKTNRKTLNLSTVCAQYITAVEHITDAVDKMLDSNS